MLLEVYGVKLKLFCIYFPQTSAVLCSGGCALLAVSSLLAIVTIFLPGGGCERRICTLAGYMQMASGKSRHGCALIHISHERLKDNNKL